MRLKLAIELCRVNKAEIIMKRTKRARAHKIAIYTPSSIFEVRMCIDIVNGFATSIRSKLHLGPCDWRAHVDKLLTQSDGLNVCQCRICRTQRSNPKTSRSRHKYQKPLDDADRALVCVWNQFRLRLIDWKTKIPSTARPWKKSNCGLYFTATTLSGGKRARCYRPPHVRRWGEREPSPIYL